MGNLNSFKNIHTSSTTNSLNKMHKENHPSLFIFGEAVFNNLNKKNKQIIEG
jgi:hypothetical protein